MKKITVKIEGTSDLLMNSPKSMLDPEPAVTAKTKKYDREIEAEKLAYKTVRGELFVPSTAIKGAIINASSYKKVGKNALRPLIAGGVRIPKEEVLLKSKGKTLKNYEIDIRTVVIQRSRVIKARPRIKNWELEFELYYNETLLPEPAVIKLVLQEAGERIGLLDFRPQKTGEFGCFKITKFEVAKR